MAAAGPALTRVRELPPSNFAVVMATGIVSPALDGFGFRLLAVALF